MNLTYQRLVLSAGLLLGCSPASPIKCNEHNETTIDINQFTDGIASLVPEEEKPRNGIIADELIDLANETHALSTERMPLEMTLTKVPDYCFEFEENVGAYGLVDPTFGELGIYVPGHISLRLLNHELGHFQTAGINNEAIPKVNEYEQKMLGYTVFQGTTDFIEWAFRSQSFLQDLAEVTERGFNRNIGKHKAAALFALEELVRTSGDYEAIRNRIQDLAARETLEPEIASAVKRTAKKYPFETVAEREKEMTFVYRMASLRELERRFGFETALEYWKSNSYFSNADTDLRTITAGLDDRLNCRQGTQDNSQYRNIIDQLQIAPSGLCTNRFNSPESAPYRSTLCCIAVEGDANKWEFKRYLVGISAIQCLSSDQKLPLLGLNWQYVEEINDTIKIEMPLEEPCL